jgi:hypothetical protein
MPAEIDGLLPVRFSRPVLAKIIRM